MRMHLNLATRDLDASVAFYRTLLLSETAQHHADYALFLTDQPGLELADLRLRIHRGASAGPTHGLAPSQRSLA